MIMKYILIAIMTLVLVSCGKSSSIQPLQLTNETAFYDDGNPCNLDSLKELSLKQNKPILLYFTGWAIVNCRSMEDRLLSDKDIHQIMHEKYIPQELYTDDKIYGRQALNILKASCMVDVEAVTYPCFLILDPRDKNDSCMDSIQEIATCGYNLEKKDFIAFLQYGLDTYREGPR